MRFVLKIKLGNEAMTNGTDIARALRRVADRVEQEGELAHDQTSGKIRDENGNSVGTWEVTR